MKSKVGELYRKSIVIGNKNEVTDNEIHISELGGENNNQETTSKVEYYEILHFDFQGITDPEGIKDVQLDVISSIDKRGMLHVGKPNIYICLIDAGYYNKNSIERDNMKTTFINGALSYGIDFNNPNHVRKVTEAEYYSLIK